MIIYVQFWGGGTRQWKQSQEIGPAGEVFAVHAKPLAGKMAENPFFRRGVRILGVFISTIYDESPAYSEIPTERWTFSKKKK